MKGYKRTSLEEAKQLAHEFHVTLDLNEFRRGIDVELEHASTIRKLAGPNVDVFRAAASIALDHLVGEDPKYYTKLAIVEGTK